MPRGYCSDMECWPLLSTAFTLFFFLIYFPPFLFSLLQSANTSTNIGSTKECFQILLESCGVTLPKARACCSAQFSCTVAIPVFPVATRASSRSCRCRASKNLSQLGTGCAGHPGGTGKRRFCQTLCASAASKLSREGFWVLLCFLSSRICAHKWDELEKGLPHLWLFESPICSFPRRFMGFHGIVVFSWWELLKKPHTHQHELLRNLQSEQVALSTPTVSVGGCTLLPAFHHSAVCGW